MVTKSTSTWNNSTAPRLLNYETKHSRYEDKSKDEHPDWIVLMRYPAKLFIKRAPDDLLTEYKWAKDYPRSVELRIDVLLHVPPVSKSNTQCINLSKFQLFFLD